MLEFCEPKYYFDESIKFIQAGANMKSSCCRLIVLTLMTGVPVVQAQAPISTYIMIDQFGYRPGDVKVAVIADPQIGFNASDQFVPGETYQVRRVGSEEVVFSGTPTVWRNGATHAQSGDKGWWFDFSALTDDGSYYLYDVERNVRSHTFDIREDVYLDVLKAALRMFYYNRCTIAKEARFAGEKWADGPSFVGVGQDGEARYVRDKKNEALIKDLSGGWFDAGDFNKYVTFAEVVIHQLLDAYTQNPHAWTDDINIPESGNGLPDILDEIIWELEWLKRMQDMNDGGVHIKNGSITYTMGSPPSKDRAPRYYEIKCSSSSIAAAGMFAHAAVVLSEFPPLADYAADLIGRAEKAWHWYHSNPIGENCDPQEIKSGDADRSLKEQQQTAVTAAIYLFAATGDLSFDDFVKSEYKTVEQLGWWGPYRVEKADALLYYTTLPNGNPTVQNDIRTKLINQARSLGDFYGFNANQDLYRAHMPDAQYHWGSNATKSNVGINNYNLITYGLDTGNHRSYLTKAAAVLHYMHGVNPLSLVQLSNMYAYGAENSVNELYHGWFANGGPWDNALTSKYGPAPGYLTGGPNKYYSGTTTGIKDQPPQKAYKDSNNIMNSWEIVEPAIYYQSAYLKLLSKFVDARFSSVEQPSEAAPQQFVLRQNYPNPFNTATTIAYRVPQPGRVTVEIFNLLGEKVATPVDKRHSAGDYRVIWNGTDTQGHDLPSGVYYCRLTVNDNPAPAAVKTMVYLK